MFRSKVNLAVIGVIVIGAVSAIGALLSAGGGAALFAAGPSTAREHISITSTATPTHVAPSPTPIPTAPVPPQTPTHSPSGQIIDLHGTIVTVDTANNSFSYKDTAGATWTIQVTATTTYEGAARRLSDLHAGMRAEVSGVPVSASTFSATHVNADD